MNYDEENITDRAKQSHLWAELSEQDGKTLPFLLERYLLLENWRRDHLREPFHAIDELSFLHLLLADATTVLLNQEERIRELEARVSQILPDLN